MIFTNLVLKELDLDLPEGDNTKIELDSDLSCFEQ
jgi:hypothetical protein